MNQVFSKLLNIAILNMIVVSLIVSYVSYIFVCNSIKLVAQQKC